MAEKVVLKKPDPKQQAALYRRYFRDEGVSAATVLEAVRLTQARTDVFIDDALALFKERDVFKAACAAGCGYCCHTLVSVLPPEAFYIARHLEDNIAPDLRAAFVERVRARDAEMRGADGAARYRLGVACAFLDPETWLCGLHTARPGVCRAMQSGSIAACKTAHESRDPTVSTPTMKVFFDNRDATMAGMASALHDHGIAMRVLELNAALVTIWDTDRAMERWLGGEDIFTAARVSAA